VILLKDQLLYENNISNLLNMVPKQSLGKKYAFPSWSLGTRKKFSAYLAFP